MTAREAIAWMRRDAKKSVGILSALCLNTWAAAIEAELDAREAERTKLSARIVRLEDEFCHCGNREPCTRGVDFCAYCGCIRLKDGQP